MRRMSIELESWPLKAPFHITGYTVRSIDLLYVEIEDGGHVGRGEASGVYYLGETGSVMAEEVEGLRHAVEAGCSREELSALIGSGGARNAIDCALWELEARLAGRTVWDMAGIAASPVSTVNTVGIDTPVRMAAEAAGFDNTHLKIKLDGNSPLERIIAVREARPEASLVVDVNQGWTFDQLQALAPTFAELGVAMIEQPLPRGEDAALEAYDPPLPLCADESCLDSSELEIAARRYQMINIKLDKTGGLTEALQLARRAKDLGLGLMVGNMIGTSLGMAPACVIAQLCRYVDIDGPTFLVDDRPHPLWYTRGRVSMPAPELWG